MPIVLSLAITLLIFPMAGILELGFVPLFLATLSATPLAPFYDLSLASLAANKVQGFALTKALGVLLVPPVIAYFVPTPWQWAFGLDALYWPAKLIWLLHAGEISYWLYLLIGLLYQFLLLIVLLLCEINRDGF